MAAEPWTDLAPDLAVTVSVGMAVSVRPRESAPVVCPAQLYRDADAALHAAKRDGTGLVTRRCA